MPIQDQKARRDAIKAEHGFYLAKRGISLHCYECLELSKVMAGYEVDKDAVVVFYPNQDESFATMMRRSGEETTRKLRTILTNPQDCRLLCKHHLDRANNGWTYKREWLRRRWPDVGYTGGPYETVAPNGKTVQVDEYLCGPWLASAQRKQFKAWREEWLAEPGEPPAYDGGYGAQGY